MDAILKDLKSIDDKVKELSTKLDENMPMDIEFANEVLEMQEIIKWKLIEINIQKVA